MLNLQPDAPNPRSDSTVAGGGLKWAHWVVLAFSLMVTFATWQWSQRSVEEKALTSFQREVDRVEGLLLERMHKYELGLWSGVAAIDAQGGSINRRAWRAFSSRLKIGERYPGILGIGIVMHVPAPEFASYLAKQRRERSDFAVFPAHEEGEYWPITYIEPEEANRAAVGLDMAHETMRYTAARKARDTGLAQITGPIVLVQDEQSTPGFLFFAPYYSNGKDGREDLETATFGGLVYSPFIAKNLVRGTLDRDSRSVLIEVVDEGATIYSEFTAPAPSQFQQQRDISLYGRTWTLSARATDDFRAAQDSKQPTVILVSGIVLDGTLLGLFLVMARGKRQAFEMASRISSEYEGKARELQVLVQKLATSNNELEHFAYLASHDLQEPLRTIRSYTALLEQRCNDDFKAPADTYLRFVKTSADRMSLLIEGLLNYSQLGHQSVTTEVDMAVIVQEIQQDLGEAILSSEASIDVGPLPTVRAVRIEIRQLFQNLISNAIKFRTAGTPPVIRIACDETQGERVFSITDNGIGIEEQYQQRVFKVFRRLHGSKEYSGTGLGLALCKKIVELHGGRIWLESEVGRRTTVSFTLGGIG